MTDELARLRTEVRILENRLLGLVIAATEFEEWFEFYHSNSEISDNRWNELMAVHESETGWRHGVASALGAAIRAMPVDAIGGTE